MRGVGLARVALGKNVLPRGRAVRDIYLAYLKARRTEVVSEGRRYVREMRSNIEPAARVVGRIYLLKETLSRQNIQTRELTTHLSPAPAIQLRLSRLRALILITEHEQSRLIT